MKILAVDPGPTQSAYVTYDGEQVLNGAKVPNEQLMAIIEVNGPKWTVVVFEQVAAMGMAVGAEVFETVFWTGRFYQQAQESARRDRHSRAMDRMKRHVVKTHLCNSMKAKDGNIRQALIDKWGGKDVAIGKKKTPGPLYGVAGDTWQALAVAVTWAETFGRRGV